MLFILALRLLKLLQVHVHASKCLSKLQISSLMSFQNTPHLYFCLSTQKEFETVTHCFQSFTFCSSKIPSETHHILTSGVAGFLLFFHDRFSSLRTGVDYKGLKLYLVTGFETLHVFVNANEAGHHEAEKTNPTHQTAATEGVATSTLQSKRSSAPLRSPTPETSKETSKVDDLTFRPLEKKNLFIPKGRTPGADVIFASCVR